LVIRGLNQTGKVSLLGSSVPVKSKVSKGSLSITPPAINPGNMPCEHAWVFKVEQFRKGSN
jgi:alpha-L-fucosidase